MKTSFNDLRSHSVLQPRVIVCSRKLNSKRCFKFLMCGRIRFILKIDTFHTASRTVSIVCNFMWSKDLNINYRYQHFLFILLISNYEFYNRTFTTCICRNLPLASGQLPRHAEAEKHLTQAGGGRGAASVLGWDGAG